MSGLSPVDVVRQALQHKLHSKQVMYDIMSTEAAYFNLSNNTLRPGHSISPSSSGAKNRRTCDRSNRKAINMSLFMMRDLQCVQTISNA